MNQITTFAIGAAIFSSAVLLGAPAVKLKDLPEAVQRTVTEQTKGAQIKSIAKEVEKGKTLYEVETTVNGRTRDLTIDTSGSVVDIEEEIALDGIPAAAKAAIEKQAAGGKVTRVEMLTRGREVLYEAVIVNGRKKSEVTVRADGSPAK